MAGAVADLNFYYNYGIPSARKRKGVVKSGVKNQQKNPIYSELLACILSL